MSACSPHVPPLISAKWFQQVLHFVARWMAEPSWGDCDIGVIALDMGFEIDSDGEWIAIEDAHYRPHSAQQFELPFDDLDLSELVFLDAFGTPLETVRDYDLSAEVDQSSPGPDGWSPRDEGFD